MSEPVKRVQFVCVENSNRSQMAEAFARIHNSDKVEVYIADSRPSEKINPKAVESMQEIGHDLSTHTSKGLNEFSEHEFDLAVTMSCDDEYPFIE